MPFEIDNLEGADLEGFRLSPQQQHAWRQLQAGTSLQSVGMVDLSGPLDRGRLLRSTLATVEAHEILRTTFRKLSGLTLPVQVIHDALEADYQVVDLRHLSGKEIDDAIQQQAQQAAPNEPGSGPVLVVRLLQLAPTQHRLLLGTSALHSDIEGLHAVAREILARYHGQHAAAGEVMQYADIAEWFYELLEDEQTQEARDYWGKLDLGRIREGLPALPYLTAGVRQGVFRPESFSRPIRPHQLEGLEKIAEGTGTTIRALLFAVWQILIARHGHDEQDSTGLYLNGRPYAELTGLPGLFARVVPVPVIVRPSSSLLELLPEVDATLEGAENRQHFFRWPSLLEDDRSALGPSFRCTFSYSEYTDLPGHAGLGARFRGLRSEVEPFCFKLAVLCQDDQIEVDLAFDAARSDSKTAARLLDRFFTLLEAVLDRPGEPVAVHPMASPEETRQILEVFNPEPLPSSSETIHHVFEVRAGEQPEKTAVVYQEQTLTYAELDQRADRLADTLRGYGVGPGKFVGLYLQRSLEMIVGLLGILKAGGAYLPLDPAYPDERIKFMLDDAASKVIVTQADLAGSLEGLNRTIVPLATDGAPGLRGPATDSASESTARRLSGPDDFAYLIYTSGSTGKPKGVPVAHRHVVHSTRARAHIYPDPPERFLLLSSHAFDSSVAGIFWTLCSGGLLVLPRPGDETDMSALAELISGHRISHILSLPSLYALLLEQAPAGSLASLRSVIVAGEACPPALTIQHFKEMPGSRLFNEYGPTEATVWCTVEPIESPVRSDRVPIGRPIANTQILILDQANNLAPIGVPGELCIAGDGVVDGYHNRPDETALRFLQHSLATRPRQTTPGSPASDRTTAERAGQLFKSGDRARWLRNGKIDFLGRVDQQVKIRGYRIEPGEIENALCDLAGVQQAVVVTQMEEPDRLKLIAYYTATGPRPRSPEEIRHSLAQRLPGFMLPSACVFLQKIPQLPNGKIDRAALPAVSQVREAGGDVQEPRNETEAVLARVMSEVLRVDGIGIRENFFEMGGDSILSIRMVAKASQAGIPITAMQIFQHQTVEELAALVGQTRTVHAEQGRLSGTVPLTPIQRWFFDLDSPNPSHANLALILETSGQLDTALLAQAMEHLLEHHDALRTRFTPGQDGWEQRMLVHAAPIEIATYDLSGLPSVERSAEISRLAARLQQSLDIQSGRLAALAQLNLGANTNGRLVLVFHHLVCDVVSLQILLEDFIQAYHQLESGSSVELPSKTTSFRYWAQQLETLAGTEILRQQVEFWARPAPAAACPIPRDFAASDAQNTIASTDQIVVTLNAEETGQLMLQAPRAYRTQVNELLVTALAQAFTAWTGQDGLFIDLESHGREDLFPDVDLSRTCGWFTSLAPIHLDLAGVPEGDGHPGRMSADLIRSVKAQLRQIPQRGVGYGIMRYLHRDPAVRERLRDLPQPEVNFNHLGAYESIVPADRGISLAAESAGPDYCSGQRRGHLIEIVSEVRADTLRFEWTYSTAFHRRATIERLAARSLDALRDLIAHCISPESGGLTPADFPDADLSEGELDEILAQIED